MDCPAELEPVGCYQVTVKLSFGIVRRKIYVGYWSTCSSKRSNQPTRLRQCRCLPPDARSVHPLSIRPESIYLPGHRRRNGAELDLVRSYQTPNSRSLSGTLANKGFETPAACAAAFTAASLGPCATSRLPSSATHSPAKLRDSLASHSSSALPSSIGFANSQLSGHFRSSTVT